MEIPMSVINCFLYELISETKWIRNYEHNSDINEMLTHKVGFQINGNFYYDFTLIGTFSLYERSAIWAVVVLFTGRYSLNNFL